MTRMSTALLELSPNVKFLSSILTFAVC